MKDWKVYYTVRNETYVYKQINNNKFSFRAYTIFKNVKNCIKYLIKGILEERKYNMSCIKSTVNGVHDGLNEKLGKNEKFLPGLKL